METPLDTLLRIAKEDPNRPILINDQGVTTYVEFLDTAKEAARTLRMTQGSAGGSFVGIYSTDFKEVWTSIFGVWIAQGVAVPLNPNLPVSSTAWKSILSTISTVWVGKK